MLKCRIIILAAFTCVLILIQTACNSSKPTLRMVDYDRIIRVACIGDSITYGAGVENREVNSYPAVLERMLGEKFQVRNFGVSGATLLSKGDNPYQKLPQYEDAARFQPDVVIIKLGTNDSKPQNWEHAKDFSSDLNALLEHFSHLPTHPKIWLCLPVPAYQVQWGINDDIIVNGVIPAIKKVAQSRRIPVIDLYDALGNRPDLFPDKIHPNAKGAELIARTVQNALLGQ